MNDITSQKEQVYQRLSDLRSQIQSIYLGQEEIVEQVLVAFLAHGHVLLEGVPGLGKTMLVKTLAALTDASFSRIQFTPDLMPADVTGHMLYDHQTGSFKINQGPVFTNLLLADEINRSPAKTQAALLEVMEELQVTLDGNTMAVGKPFMVLATQNPIEQEGTYNLPEAQLDRFIMKINIHYPREENELALLNAIVNGQLAEQQQEINAVITKPELVDYQKICSTVVVDKTIQQYILSIVRHTREDEAISYGAGPRGGIALVKCSQAYALLHNRDYVLPDDVKAVLLPVLRHRIILSPEYELSGVNNDDILNDIVKKVTAPRE